MQPIKGYAKKQKLASIKNTFNAQIMHEKQTLSDMKLILDNYNMGLISVKDFVNQNKAVLTFLSKEII